MLAETFAIWLRRQLQRREWTQAKLSRTSGLSQGRISDWLAGKRLPNPDSCDKLADALGADLDYVLVLAGHRPADIDRDPRVEGLVKLIRQIRLTKDREETIRSALEGMIRTDQGTEREAESESRARRPQSSRVATDRDR